ncbi:MAG: DUF5110 domain-containing protein, partial [Anaerolineales bacterium]|nr:DUF5110 domain-containing protein [Anaerolineales bacterium]
WWSRFWRYSQAELQGLMAAFREHEVPLSVCIVDMDWHLTNISETVSGWTGYTWNQELFPDPAGFVNWLHNQGLHTALNLHPASGVYPHEEQYEAMAARLGHDTSAAAPIPFNIPSPEFANAYFELLHHPYEEMGVDFWWLDWQQGELSGLPGLDPLWWLNHLHFYDLARHGDRRSFIFSRWGGLGNHRYPIGFSGDTVVDWASLAFQPYFTATAANVGYGWWSHDIGGHMFGQEDRELYTRWVQFGVFSPIMRLHSTNNRYHERRPWGYDAEVLRITRDAMQLRHALIPYLYTLSWENATAARSPIRPMYHEYPAADEAYHCPNQYLLGTDLIVAPFLEPADETTGLSRTVVWLPEGHWFDFFDGTYYQGGGWYAIYGALDRIPVFARAGTIVPLGPKVGWGGVGNPAELTVHLFAGANQQFTLYEDDGATTAFEDGAYSLTNFIQQWSPRQLTLIVEPAGAPADYLPDERTYHFCLHGVRDPGQVLAAINDEQAFAPYEYDAAREELRLSLKAASADRLTISLNCENDKRLWARRDRTLDQCRVMLAAFHLPSIAKETLYGQMEKLLQEPAILAKFALTLSEAQERALLEVSQQAGVHHVRDTRDPDLVILWNNRENSGIQFQYVRQMPDQWNQPHLFRSSQGDVPRFRAIVPRTRADAARAAADEAKWQLSVSYWDLLQWRIEG